jgi:hypothetical protein
MLCVYIYIYLAIARDTTFYDGCGPRRDGVFFFLCQSGHQDETFRQVQYFSIF